jgi:hypothetical protein
MLGKHAHNALFKYVFLAKNMFVKHAITYFYSLHFLFFCVFCQIHPSFFFFDFLGIVLQLDWSLYIIFILLYLIFGIMNLYIKYFFGIK